MTPTATFQVYIKLEGGPAMRFLIRASAPQIALARALEGALLKYPRTTKTQLPQLWASVKRQP